MPRVSDRQKVLKQLDSVIKRRRVKAAFQLVSYDSDDSDSDVLVEGIIDNVMEHAYNTVLLRRYLLPRKPYRNGLAHYIFQRDLQREDNPDATPPWLGGNNRHVYWNDSNWNTLNNPENNGNNTNTETQENRIVEVNHWELLNNNAETWDRTRYGCYPSQGR